MKYLNILFLLLFSVQSSFAVPNTEEENSKEKDELVVGVKHSPPFLIEKDEKIERGVAHDLWIKLAEEQGLEYRFEKYDLNGLLNALEEERIDISIAPLTVTSERLERMDFTQPLYISNLAIATRQQGENQILLFLWNFFSWDFLRATFLLITVILIFGLLLWWVERRKNPEMFQTGWKGILDGFWWSAVTMTTVGYGDKAPKSGPGKFIATIWMFTAVIIISGFTATIASSLTVQRAEQNIEGLQDLARVRTATVEASNSARFLQERGIQPVETKSLEEAMEMLADEEVQAIFYDEPNLRYSIHDMGYGKELMVLDKQFEEQHYAFAMSKDSPYFETINLELIRALESDHWDRILQRYEL